MFVKSDFFVYSRLEHSSDKKKKGLHFFGAGTKLISRIAALAAQGCRYRVNLTYSGSSRTRVQVPS